MLRRNFLKTIPAVAMMQGVKAAPRLKITDVRLIPLKVLRETGSMEAAWNPGVSTVRRVGGGAYLEIHTDQGLIGIGPAMDDAVLANTKAHLVGKYPFHITHMPPHLPFYLTVLP